MADPIHILITGGAGQVGLELLAAVWPEGVVLHAPARAELDLGDAASVRAAFAANAMGPAVLADATREAGIPLIQVSTDYVFDGAKTSAYVETDPVGPLGVYGASKLAGELAVRSGNPRSVVLRTAWVLSVHRANFLKTMLRLAADRPALRVVGDQHGCPTSARDIAVALKTITLRMVADEAAPTGVYHFVNAGETTWAGLAQEVFAVSAAIGGPSATVEAIPSSEYPTPARRPSNSRLSTEKLNRDFEIAPRPWQVAVAEIVHELHAERTAP